ncbi:MAG: hypothetical protein Q8J80_05405 [Gallionella sp.]|nr:hypothetical protein [Gallionella sp.]
MLVLVVVLVVLVVLVLVLVLAVVLAVVLRPAAVSAAVSVWRVLLALPQDWPQRLRSQRTPTRLRLRRRCRLRLPDIAISRSNEKSPFGGFSFSAADFLVPVRPGDGFFSTLEVCHGCSTGGVI